MAKRKRLSPAALQEMPADLETKSLSQAPVGVVPRKRAPIADVAGEAATIAAMDELAQSVHAARREGRLVTSLPLDVIAEDHMVRDRMVIDADEMESLKASLRMRGQQTPIEVVETGQGAYGLISGWRRLHAFRALNIEADDARFAEIQALIKPLDSVSDAYVAMVEENEIRTDLSFYERAHLACEAARLGVYETPRAAVAALFANATSTRRSKIGSFVRLHEALGDALQFPSAIPEKLGLALVKALEAEKGFVARLKDVLRKTQSDTPEAERATLEKALRKGAGGPTPQANEVQPGIRLEAKRGRVVLSGPGVTEDLGRKLAAWLAAQ